MKTIGTFFLIAILANVCIVSAEPYHSLPTQCDGFPQLPLVTPKNICVGLVVQKSPDLPIKKPRSLIEIDSNQLLVIDAGSSMPSQGSLLLIDYSSSVPKVKILLSKLNLPHKILVSERRRRCRQATSSRSSLSPLSEALICGTAPERLAETTPRTMASPARALNASSASMSPV